jgi:uncharacterized protein (TIGR04222 family)
VRPNRPSSCRRPLRSLALAATAVAAVLALPASAWAAAAASPVETGRTNVAGRARAAQGQEQITRYHVTMTLDEDASMAVTEEITWDFADTPDKHGIIRQIPTAFAYDDTYERVYPISDIEVSSPTGAPDETQVEEGNVTSIRIGDADEEVTGVQQYVLRYKVGGVVNSLTDHQELYWNAIGDEWSVPMSDVRATVRGPAGVDRATCFLGVQGSTTTCDHTVARGVATFSAPSLQPAEGLTVVAAFPAGTFPDAGPILREPHTLARAFTVNPATVGLAAAILALGVGGAVAMVVRRGRDQRYLDLTPGLEPLTGQSGVVSHVPWLNRDPIAVQFQPPKDMRPGQLGTLIDEQANVVDVTATLVDLAVRGFLKIEEIQKEGWFKDGDWRLVKITPARTEDLRDYEIKLLNSIFQNRDEVLLSQLKQTFRSDLQRVQELLYHDVTRNGWFRGNPASVRLRWQIFGVVLALAGAGLTWLLAANSRFGLVGLAVVVAGLVLLVMSPRMPARTARGTAMLAQAKGFREYLKTAEADQIRFEEGVDIFSRYLPFAIVFGVAERWAKVFAQLAERGVDVAAPTWYVGSGIHHGAFNYAAFGGAMDGFATEASGSLAAATPSSSGSSGFGGGGFSGGGGGGGGGGSW